MMFYLYMIMGILLFAALIDYRRRRNNNTKHTRHSDPATKKGESSNYQSGEGRDW
ncbi:hypothetical protein [Rossellomorea marisflavi]|uniref:hypothetical protein n=1 Tax=Rossellomorea marisflavi TaxID=189381 RepID=UPI0015C43ECC|nr:hypothetical protein [Rossellomorea marisflavi]